MAQPKVLEKIHEDLKQCCFGMAIKCQNALEYQTRNGQLSEYEQSVYVEALFQIMWAHAHMQLQYGLYMNSYNKDTVTFREGDYVCEMINRVINSLDKLEAKCKTYDLEDKLEKLKACLISATEYDGTWEALYTTEERPF